MHDAGRLINPLLAARQVHGALAQGIGQALVEGLVYSSEGQPLTGGLLDYAVPRVNTTPAFALETLETPFPLNPLGVKGIGSGHVGGPRGHCQCRDGRALPHRHAPY